MPLEFLNPPQGEEQTAAPEVVAETVAEPAPQAEAPAQPDEQPRGPDGKFAPTTPAPTPEVAAPTPVAEPAPPPASEPQIPSGYVHASALHQEREKRRAAEARLAEQRPPQPQQEAPEPPDRYEDPDGYAAHVEQVQQSQRLALNAQWSERFATQVHGAEVVQQAREWAEERFNQDPAFRQRSLASPDPYGFAVAEHQREQALQMLTDPKTLETFRAWQAQQGQPTAPQAEPTAAPVASVAPLNPPPQAPPRSIASAPSAGGPATVPIGPGQAFEGLFRKG